MASIVRKFKEYHEQFGWKGLWLALKTRASPRPFEACVHSARFKYPIHLRFKTTDTPTFKKILQDGEYDFPARNPPAFIVDAGANVGFASLFFTIKYPQARIIALEPERENFKLLKKNTEHYPNIIPIRAALWKEPALLDLIDPGMGPWAFQVHEASSPKNGRVIDQVQAFSVDSILQQYGANRVDILKIDIEGGEREVFENPFQWIDRVEVIMAELHDQFSPECSRNFYTATKDFEVKERRGETVFLLKKR